MKIKPVVRDNNPFFPLPSDYNLLTTEGQRQARVNTGRLWLLPGSIAERIEWKLASFHFFDMYYLTPDHEVGFNPMFYDMDPLPHPPMHDSILAQWATSRLGASVAPRGGAKTVLCSADMLQGIVTCPGYSYIYAASTHENTKIVGQRVKTQVQFNDRLWVDYGPEFPDGRITPKRGEATFSTTFFMLRNNSWLRCISAQGKQRGGRPRQYRLDDAEYDPKKSTSMSVLREYMEELIFKIALPMVMRQGAALHVIGTMVSRRHYIYQLLQPPGPETDPRLRYWDRMLIPAEYELDGEHVSCWPEMWPVTVAERLRLAENQPEYHNRASLEEVRKLVGDPIYRAEYLNAPGDPGTAYFGELNVQKHGWWLEKVDDKVETEPHASTADMCWYEEKQVRRVKLSEFVTYARLFLTADTSDTDGPSSDPKAWVMLAATPNNDLFVLDVWSRRCNENDLVKSTFKAVDRWHCPSMHPETIRRGHSIFAAMSHIVATRAKDMAGTAHLPAVAKLNPGVVTKSDKIASLRFRFDHGKIKLPLWNRMNAEWRPLFTQITDFNPESNNGGLQNDDLIDCVAMSQFVLKGRVHRSLSQAEQPLSAVDRMKRGELHDQVTGLPIAYGIDWNNLNREDFEGILDGISTSHPELATSKV